ncbi:MAG: 50S ribosomal protein L2 [Patescibacteria group bacterium]|nr:50S ribosomal protein L2 [Patescibacteria group bacterium]
MPIRQYRPTSPGRRLASVSTFAEITRSKPEKSLITFRKAHSGRNAQGKITVRHRGGGEKRFIRMVDFVQERFNIPAKVVSIEYDPNRQARIALVHYANGEKQYLLAPEGLQVGATVVASRSRVELSVGNRMPLEAIPPGTVICNVEIIPGKGGELARSAGTTVKLLAIDGPFAQIELPSKEIRLVSKNCLATVGQVSNPDAMHLRVGKAGRKRHMGWRPTVRGKAQNPNDHPHGGGEGNQPIGLKAPKTKWGKLAFGVKTRQPHKYSDRMILKRRPR